MTRTEFAGILNKMNAMPGRKPGQCTASVCRAWDAGSDAHRAINAILGWEIGTRTKLDDPSTGRLATPQDMKEILTAHIEFERSVSA